ncbi:ABC transporter substrate-binding protein [Cellulomonas gilvus]|uniref:NMT1/THI5 like domain protein n=1 Tax=Cellulomonas gilvus (strain ATCC 13127 / NRRL B-14078) TaxID=593907 RepID=F8A0L2_CELGA|nr:ABC transporter substrate-binding protein [Cellulomonas gilvus]AEI12697.1 NMT1/THI5 like domain protein [Cellulomonas gilvus ATCC 13127]
MSHRSAARRRLMSTLTGRPGPTSARRRPAAAAAALVAAALALAGCTAADAADGPTHVTVVLDWTPNTNHSGLYLALERGYFTDAGLDVDVVEPGETSGLQMVAVGKAQFAYSVAEGLVPAREQGADVVSVATVIEHNTSSLISLASAGITRPRDLAGKRYGSYGSELESALIRRLVECDGGDPDAVQMPPLTSDDFRIGLTAGQYDAAWVFDAWDTIRLRDVDGLDVTTLAFADHTDCIPDWYTPLVATSAELVEEDPATVRAFVGALAHGYRDAMDEPDAAADALLAAAPELEPELVERSAAWLATRYADDPAAWGRQDARVWTDFVAFLQDNDLADEGFDTAAAWTDEFLP